MKALTIIVACFSVCGLASASAATAQSGAHKIRIEAEATFTVVADSGENPAIGVADGEGDSGQSVTLYDIDDAIQVRFSAPATRSYRIAARVRAGGSEEPLGFWPDGYRFKLDGKAITLTGDEATQSALDESYGGCFWGTMLSQDIALDAGEHTLEVAANTTWAVVDFFEVTAVGAEPPVAVSPAGSGNADARKTGAAAGFPQEVYSVAQRVEAEETFTIVKEAGKNGDIGVADGELDSGESVRLYDRGDTIRISVTVPADGEYRVEVRVRSGGSTGEMSFWPAGYRATQDGKPLRLVGLPESVSARDASYGGSFWGTMRSDVLTLTAGGHAVDIEAASDWAVLDYVQLLRVNPNSSAALVLPRAPVLTTKRP